MFKRLWQKKVYDPVSFTWAAFFAAVAQQVAVTLVLTIIARALLKKPRQSVPDLEAQQRTIMEPNPPRTVAYGRAWLSPRIINNSNPSGYQARFPKNDVTAGGFRGYSLHLAVADHPVLVKKFLVNGDQFLTKDEMERLNRGAVTLCDPYADKQWNEFQHTDGGGGYRGSRKDADDRARAASIGVPDFTMCILPKLQYQLRFEERYSRTLGRNERVIWRVHPLDDPDQFKSASSSFLNRAVQSGYTDQHIARDYYASWDQNADNFVYIPVTNQARYGGKETLLQRILARYSTPIPANHHCYGTSTMEMILPIGAKRAVSPVWPNPPEIKMQVERHHELARWDPKVPGNPAIGEWHWSNAAMCVYDFLVKYTRFGKPVCGYSRIDLKSVARAADICQEKGYFLNGVFNLANSPQEVLRQMEYALGNGWIAERAGVAYVFAGSRDLPVYRYDSDEIVENSWEFQTTPPRESRRGMIDVAYLQESDGTRQDVATENPDAADALQIQQTQFMFINNAAQAAKAGFILNARAWETQTLSLKLQPGVPLPEVNDIVQFDLGNVVGISGDFRVVALEEEPEDGGAVSVVAISERANLYDIDAATLLAQNNYIPPAPRRGGFEPLCLAVGLKADGTIQVLGTDDDTTIRLNNPAPAGSTPPSP